MSSFDWAAHYEGFPAITQYYHKRILETGCYEEVLRYPYHVMEPNNYHKRVLFRILPKPECMDRLIKRGYYRFNKSLGKANDFDRAIMGFDSPYKEKVDAIRKEFPLIFK